MSPSRIVQGEAAAAFDAFLYTATRISEALEADLALAVLGLLVGLLIVGVGAGMRWVGPFLGARSRSHAPTLRRASMPPTSSMIP